MMHKNCCVIGGGGYVGSVLVPKLLALNYDVSVLDLFMYGDYLPNHKRLFKLKGDVRNPKAVSRAVRGCDSVIHLACISNDPSFELDEALGKAINYDCFRDCVRIAKAEGVGRFIYASSSSVYGLREESEVTEEIPNNILKPLTQYSQLKLMCEEVLFDESELGFTTSVLRPATVCGYSPRQRLDLVVNIMTNTGYNTDQIKVFGGPQQRPNIHIEDMANAYEHMLVQPAWYIDRQVFNVGGSNYTLDELSNLVQSRLFTVTGKKPKIIREPSSDLRSYHISSGKIQDKLGYSPTHLVSDAIDELVDALSKGLLPDSMTDSRYFNIKQMQKLNLK